MGRKIRRVGLGIAFASGMMVSAHAADTIGFGHVGAPSAIVWPIYIGLDQGVFDERNLKIDLVFTRSSARVLRQLAAGVVSEASKSDVLETSQSYDYYRKIGFFERSATVSKAALQSLVAVLQKNGEIKGDLPAEKLMMPGVARLGP